MKGSGGGAKLDRKTVEKNRRLHMKTLCFKLTSLIPMAKPTMTQHDLLDQAFSYINELNERVEKLKQKKEKIRRIMVGSQQPIVEVRNLGSNLEVILVCGLKTRFMFHNVIRIFEEQGAEVINASFSIVGDKIFHAIHCQAVSPRIGFDPSSVHERLKELVC